MRIATFNLETLDLSADADPPLADRLPVLRPQVERLRADILCLQEVNAQAATNRRHGPRRLAALDALLDGTEYAGFHRAATETRGRATPLDVHNLVVLSRWPIDACRQYWNDLVPPPTVRVVTADPPDDAPRATGWDRPLLHAAVALPNDRRLHVLNLHLRAPLAAAIAGQKESAFVWKSAAAWAEGFHLASLRRTGQALEARLAIDGIFDGDPDALIVVCGDMNAELREMPLRILCADAEDTGNGRLATRALVPLAARVPEAIRYTLRHAGQRLQYDHLLASRALAARCSGLHIHNETLGDEVVGYTSVHHSPESYHAPVVATFGD